MTNKFTVKSESGPMTRPYPGGTIRQTEAERRRTVAAMLSGSLDALSVPSNEEESDYGFQPVINFSKGLPHDEKGLVDASVYKEFVESLTKPDTEFKIKGDPKRVRGWESPLAGHYYNMQGPDSAAVAMAPAPRLGSSELCAELAEVYAMALVRDLPLHKLKDGKTELPCKFPAGHPSAGKPVTMQDLLDELKKLPWFDKDAKVVSSQKGSSSLTKHEQERREARWHNGELTLDALFRGSADGAKVGPYVSQFLLLGTCGPKGAAAKSKDAFNSTAHRPEDGYIRFGPQTVDQRVYRNEPELDFMTTWPTWLEIQKGAKPDEPKDFFQDTKGFLTTGRDLATYVHYDQLYQAYFNACLIMLNNGVDTDPGFPEPNDIQPGDLKETREAFATFGGPHILSLLTEVASRALKAVRRQKFQIHRRARPEVLAARLTQVANKEQGKMNSSALNSIKSMLKELGFENIQGGSLKDPKKPGLLLMCIAQMNAERNKGNTTDAVIKDENLNFLLPMAFSEGSPMHAAYGAGHATVAGACITILKAFFREDTPLDQALSSKGCAVTEFHCGNGDTLFSTKENIAASSATVAGELDKLASNISIGRNMAGVHYYSDYFDSLRMGERVAAQILADQMLTYTEEVSISFKSFDGDMIKIGTDGASKWDSVEWTVNGGTDPKRFTDWWTYHVSDHLSKDLDEMAIS